MPEIITESLSVNTGSTEDITIRLDGATATVTIGGAGLDGSIVLTDSAAERTLRLSVVGEVLRVTNAAGEDLAVLDSETTLGLGGNGSNGTIILRDPAGVPRMELDAHTQQLRIRSATGDVVAVLGPNANLTLGGNGQDGDLLLRDASNRERIHLDADGQLLRFRNTAGQEVARLGDNANLHLGGNGQDGDILLRDSAGRDRITMDADNQRVRMYNAAGQMICDFGPHANLRLGTNGSDGDILLFPSSASDLFANGSATIHLDADAGDITLRNADCAEEFDIAGDADVVPGTVMALDASGALCPSSGAYETRVVGVVSGAGRYRPGIVLDRQPGVGARTPVAMMGKTFVRVTDEGGPIRPGDLLVSAGLTGCAMRAADPARAFGAVIGKAMSVHTEGEGLIPMVIALQ